MRLSFRYLLRLNLFQKEINFLCLAFENNFCNFEHTVALARSEVFELVDNPNVIKCRPICGKFAVGA